MRNADICPYWRGAGVERYYGCNRRDTRRVRTKIYNFCRREAQHTGTELPDGLCNSWITNGITFTPMWVRQVPKTYYCVDYFVLLVHTGTSLLGWWRCFEHNDFYGERCVITLPNGMRFYAEWHTRGLNDILTCDRFYRPYEEPTKDLGRFDIWRAEHTPSFIAAQIVRKARQEWVHYGGTARYAYEKGERAYHMEIMMRKAKREGNASIIKRGGHSAEFNKRQLRALGFVV